MTLEKHHFTVDGKKYSVPKFADIPVGVLRKSRKAKDEMDTVFTIIELTMGEGSDALDAIDSMNSEDFQTFLAGWTQGAPVGESSSSES